MLNRIRVRGKLFLLLVTPLLAVVVFAYIGVVNRLDTASAQSREEVLARLADSGSQLSTAVSQERLLAMMVGAGAERDLEAATLDTQVAILDWFDASADARPLIRSAATRDRIDSFTLRLQEQIERANKVNRSTTSVVAELSILSRSMVAVTGNLADEAEDLSLFKALSIQDYAATMQNAATQLAVVGTNSIRTAEISTVAAGLLDDAFEQLAEASTEFQDQAGDVYVAMLADLRNSAILPRVSGGGSATLQDLEQLVANADAASQIAWLQLGVDRVEGIQGLSEQVLGDASGVAAQNASTAHGVADNFMILAISVGLAALLMAVLMGRAISRPLLRLSRSANQLSSEELPALVESMRTGGRTAPPDLTPIRMKGRDEVADLAGAISDIQRVTLDVAQEQTALLHRGISDMFVNLARRNQSLLDRQIQFLDGLEADEEDADQLDNLFRLDHLATRMRRNAESLLILAGADQTKRRGSPVTVQSVARVAASEIEDYARVDFCSLDECHVPSVAAEDLAHMASELMENAAQFSPPDSRIEVVGHLTLDGGYLLTIADHGIGMTAEQITRSNRLLSEPPVMGLDMGRSLGFTVIARLAEKLATSVRLTPTPGGGTTAVVSLSPSLLVEEKLEPPSAAPEEPSVTPEPESLVAPEGDRDLFEMFGVPNAPATSTPTGPVEPTVQGQEERPPTRTSAGLVRRTPGRAKGNVAPMTVDRPAVKERTPEQVREMLSSYRTGLRRGRDGADHQKPSETK